MKATPMLACNAASRRSRRAFSLPLLIAAVFAAWAGGARAADGTWNADADGLWSLNANWLTNIIAEGSGFTANFTYNITADRTVHLDGNSTLTSIVFSDSVTTTPGSWILDNNGTSTNHLILAGTTPTITINALGTGKTAAISAIVEGATGLTKAGAGTLSLGGANIYSGSTTITAGALRAVDGVGLPGGSYLILSGGGFESSGTFTRANNTATAGTNFKTTGSSNTLFGAYGGKLTITIGNDASIAQKITGTNAGNVTNGFRNLNFGTATSNAEVEFQNNIDMNAATHVIDVAPGDSSGNFFVTFSGVISNGGLGIQGAGRRVITGQNTYNLLTTLNNATSITILGNKAALGTSTINITGGGTLQAGADLSGANKLPNPVTWAGTGILTVSGTNNLDIGGITTNATGNRTLTSSITGGGLLTLSGTVKLQEDAGAVGRILTLAGTGNTTISGQIVDGGTGGSSGITYANTGTTTVTNANTYTGQTILQKGVLNVTSLNSVNGGTPLLVGSNLGAPITVGNGTIKIGLTTNVSPATTLIYSGTGETTDRVIDLAGTTAGATLDQSGSGNLKFTSNTGTGNAFTATGVGTKTLTLQGSTAGTGEIAAAIVDNAAANKTSLTKSGTGTWTLSGANTYIGTTTINAGTLKLGTGGSLAAASSVSIAASATLDVTALTSASATYAWNTASLSASGAAAPATMTGTSGGTVDMGNKPISLTFDGSDPSLTVTGAALLLGGNQFTVVVPGTALGAGVYTLVSADSVSETSTVNPTPLYGVHGLATGATGVVSISGNTVILTVTGTTTYGVTYNGNGSTSGTPPTDSIGYLSGATVTVPASGTLAKTGYAFSGWNTATTGTGTAYDPAATFTITANTILYAQWIITYASWANTHSVAGGPATDSDNDGVSNGVEFFMNITTPGFTANPSLNGSNTVTWTNGGNIPPSAYGSQFVVQSSTNLVNWTDVPGDDPNLSNTTTAVSYTLTGNPKSFVRLKVTPN